MKAQFHFVYFVADLGFREVCHYVADYIKICYCTRNNQNFNDVTLYNGTQCTGIERNLT